MQWYWKADFVKEIGDEAIARHKQFGTALPTERCTMHLYPINGAVHKVGRNETAFNFRDATWSRVILGVDEDPASAERISTWAKEYWEALHPYSAGVRIVPHVTAMQRNTKTMNAFVKRLVRFVVHIIKLFDRQLFYEICQQFIMPPADAPTIEKHPLDELFIL